MKDVQEAIASTRTELDQFASAQLNNLTFSYLDDIVEQKDESSKRTNPSTCSRS